MRVNENISPASSLLVANQSCFVFYACSLYQQTCIPELVYYDSLHSSYISFIQMHSFIFRVIKYETQAICVYFTYIFSPSNLEWKDELAL